MDATETARRELQAALNATAEAKKETEKKYGQVWTTDELTAEFSVVGFAAPFVVVVRKSDNVKGSMMFQHNPRLYFQFSPA